MVVKIQRWGNSLALRLPKAVVEKAGLGEGSSLDVEAKKGQIVPRSVRRYRLQDLLDGITPGTLHAEVSTGPRRGREAW
ncbi:MAG: AbrB/MazE/SpoVT family DNA-binding domain-containing protein [Deltaproteobacteria bacterium]|nr:AbrB/MazE/SpoVT family DNA-binding domain-containing protein [Deltaproteobacteria bacterium]